jgi:8-oxo-dGTP diphosphatase
MALYLVRHAKAGSRSTWDGDDFDRPLTSSGWNQAKGLAETLGEVVVTRLLSSPYLRCTQTLEPLRDRFGLAIEVTQVLAEGMGAFEDVLSLLESIDDGAVLCSHGDVIPEAVQALERRGMSIEGAADWRKGVTWVLERSVDGDGVVRFTRATVWPPPS